MAAHDATATAAVTPGRVLGLRRIEDLHCVAFHLLLLAGYGVAFYLYLHPERAGIDSPWSRTAFVAGAAIVLGWCSGVDVGVVFHNHAHVPIFHSPFANRWFGRLWTVSGGWPAYFWRHAHLVVHHSKLLSSEDWTLPRRRPDGGVESLYRYCLAHWPFRNALHLYREFRHGTRPGVAREAALERSSFLAFWSLPFLFDVQMALLLWVLPQYLGNVAVMGPGMYVQHVGCRPRSAEHPHLHSNTFLNRFFNLTMFNIGFHIEHHERGHVHWADLPVLHRRMQRELIAPAAHVLAIGYYRGGRICRWQLRRDWLARFLAHQHPRFLAPGRAHATERGDAGG